MNHSREATVKRYSLDLKCPQSLKSLKDDCSIGVLCSSKDSSMDELKAECNGRGWGLVGDVTRGITQKCTCS